MTGTDPEDTKAFGGLLDVDRLNDWILTQDLPGRGPITDVVKLDGGSQNNIFLIRRNETDMVLRRPPRHLRANSNETMLREARVLTALADAAVPHPACYGSCADVDVIGCCFYLMSPIDGFTPRGDLPEPYARDPEWQRAIPFEMVRAAASLAEVDHSAVGLAGFGRPDNWLERQVGRWRSQLEGYLELPGYQAISIPHVESVGDWLDRNRPVEGQIGILHGDFQFANVMFSRDTPRLAAVVDWELSSLGDPMLDLAWMLTALVEDGDPPGRDHSFAPAANLPTRAELVTSYGELTGRSMLTFPWYFVLACYKLGIILEGSHARALSGLAETETGDRLHQVATWLLERAYRSTAAA